ncbi:MAG: lactonase family protein, partial [Planctomycetaceae bacterium]
RGIIAMVGPYVTICLSTGAFTMIHDLVRSSLPFVACAMLALAVRPASADEPLVFISAFAEGDDGAIHAYQLDVATGALKLLTRTTDVENPFFLAVSRDNKFLYSIHSDNFGDEKPEQVAAYAVQGRTGELKLLNRQSAEGTAACYLDVDASGKMVLCANYSTGSVISYPVQQDGSLGEPASFVQHAGTSVDPARQEGPHAHCFVISPDNRYAYSADLGLDKILGYTIDPKTAKLTPNKQAFARTPPGAGPRHLTFHPRQPWMYVINEMANSITMYDYDAKTGNLIEHKTISTLPDGYKEASYCADLKITPNGKYLYGTNRGHHSIAMYEIGDDGQLTLIGIEPSLGDGPQNLAITAGGELLLCANMPGNNVVVFSIDAETGKLKAIGDPIEIPMPSCIMIR